MTDFVAARHVEPVDASGRLTCLLCPHACRLAHDQVGRCRVRINHNGRMLSTSSASVAAAADDPMEKKPLFHFLPGSRIFSIGTPGCNMSCTFCQNHSLSQATRTVCRNPRIHASPSDLAQKVLALAREKNCASIAYTYNEPTVFFELVDQTAQAAAQAGLANVLVSNAYMGKGCLQDLAPLIQAANFDLKSFRDEFYRTLCGATLAPVLRTMREAVRQGWWVEITTLLVPGHNDSAEELGDIASFIANELGVHVPWHVSRFRPMYRLLDVPSTPPASIGRALEAGSKAGLQFVYAGNVPGHPTEDTLCPSCATPVIKRHGYRLLSPVRHDCPGCGHVLPGIWCQSGSNFQQTCSREIRCQ